MAGDERIYAVENPSLIAEASSGWTGPPLVCASGRPTIAAVILLRQLPRTAFIHQHNGKALYEEEILVELLRSMPERDI